MTNEEWKKAYREGYRDGRDDADKKMNYTNFPPVYYGGVATGINPRPGADTVTGSISGGLRYTINETKEHFATGMSLSSSDC